MSVAIPPLPQYAFMAWCLVKKHRNNFTFTLHTGLAVPSFNKYSEHYKNDNQNTKQMTRTSFI
jgi:uncharacterized short protein YbdD (DUF466 family)